MKKIQIYKFIELQRSTNPFSKEINTEDLERYQSNANVQCDGWWGVRSLLFILNRSLEISCSLSHFSFFGTLVTLEFFSIRLKQEMLSSSDDDVEAWNIFFPFPFSLRKIGSKTNGSPWEIRAYGIQEFWFFLEMVFTVLPEDENNNAFERDSSHTYFSKMDGKIFTKFRHFWMLMSVQ